MSAKRTDYYKLPEVEALFLDILEKKEKVDPAFDLKIGYRYPDVEEAIKFDAPKTIGFLEQLYNAEILDREVYDMELSCPYCNSSNVSVYYLCPHCQASKIKKTLLLEHMTCGYMGPVASLGEPLICPKCGKRMAEGEYRNTGSIYECEQCNQQIDTPFVNHWCRVCGKKFNFDNSIYQAAYSYFPRELVKKDMESGILYISKIADVFKELGLSRLGDAKTESKLGPPEVFDAAFEGNGAKIFLDLLYSEAPIHESELISEYGKILNVDKNVFVIAVPGLDQRASVIVKSYNINLVEAPKPLEALTKLKAVLIEKLPKMKVNMKVETQAKKKG
jgi:uncharacterized CHY-type Zn-finger protein